MRTLRGFVLLALLCSLGMARAQNTFTVQATGLSDSEGSLVTTGQLCAAPTDGQGNPLSYRLPGMGQATTKPVCTAITAPGTFSFHLPNVALTNPKNVCFALSLTDDSMSPIPLLGSGSSCIQPTTDVDVNGNPLAPWCSASTMVCNFDNFVPNTPTIPVMTIQAQTNVSNTYTNVQEIDVAGYSGAEICAKLTAAQAANPGTATFAIQTGTCSTTATLGAHHSVHIYGDLSLTGAGSFTPTTFNTLYCSGSGQIINAGMNNIDDNQNKHNPILGGGGTTPQHIRFHDCAIQGGSNGVQAFYSFAKNTDVSIDHLDISNGIPYAQHSAPANDPSENVSVSENDVHWDGGYNLGYYPLTVFGAWQNSKFSHNRITATTGGVIVFAEYNGQLGATNPSREQIKTDGLKDDTISDNVMLNLIQTNSCVFTSSASHLLIANNECHGAGDVGIDLEATVDTLVVGNTVEDDTTACFGGFYTEANNVFRANHCIANSGQEGFVFQNAGGYPYIVTDIVVEGNSYYSPNVVGIFAYLHASQKTIWRNNDVRNGVIADAGIFRNSELWDGNTFRYTATLPASNIGDTNLPGFGLYVGNNSDGSFDSATNNWIITEVPQNAASPCINIGISASNSISANALTGNHCIGPWTRDLHVNSGGTNSAFPPTFAIRENELSHCAILADSSTGVQPVVNKLNNYFPGGAPCN